MSTISQSQQCHGPRRAFGSIINTNSTPRNTKGGASAITDEVHSAKKEKQKGLFAMATRSSMKRAASLKEADENEDFAAVESRTKKTATTAAALSKAFAAVTKTLLKEEEEAVGEEFAATDVFRTQPEMDAAFWDEMGDLLEIKLANPIGSFDEFDVSSSDGDVVDKQDNLKEEEVAGDV